MATILIYSTGICPYCVAAERLLKAKGAEIEKIRIDLDPSQKTTMIERTGRRTVPQIYIDDYHVGGYEELVALERSGKLNQLLGA